MATPPPESDDTAHQLDALSRGDASSADRLSPTIYAELRALAGSFFRRQAPDHTLQPTALVHEAFLRLMGTRETDWASRAHFLAVAARAMRHILINHAERRAALKRGGDRRRVPLRDAVASAPTHELDLLALNEALSALEAISARRAQVVEMKCFGGMTIEEIARVIDVSTTTVENDWRFARAWLAQRIEDHSD